MIKQMGVSKNRGKTSKMDGENIGKPYEQMDDLGVGSVPLFLDIFASTPRYHIIGDGHQPNSVLHSLRFEVPKNIHYFFCRSIRVEVQEGLSTSILQLGTHLERFHE